MNPVVVKAAGRKTLVDLILVPNQEESRDARIELKGASGSLHYDTTPVVATHNIHCYSHNDGLDAA